MENEFDLIYCDDALLDRVLFLASEIEVNIFVEDLGKEVEYEIFFEKLISKDFHIGCIFPTNGKNNMKKAYELFGSPSSGEKNFFIADGDFDKILGIPMIEADNFIYLNRYNIESYLLNKDAVISYMRDILNKQKDDVEKLVNYDKWIGCINPFLKKLFSVFYYIQKQDKSFKTVGYRESKFILPTNGNANQDAFNKFVKDFENSSGMSIQDRINESINKLSNKYGEEIGCFVCGKYLITSLQFYLMSVSGKNIKYQHLNRELIKGLDVSNLFYLKEKILTYISS